MKTTSLRKITREKLAPEPLYGIILKESENFLLIAREFDFVLDGYQIIRKSDITTSVSNKSCKYVFKILKAEGILDSLLCPEINLDNWQSIFRSLGKGHFTIIQDEASDIFLIGPVIRINKSSIVLKYFDGVGEWEEEERMKYKDITSLEFDTNYLNLHEKYIKKK